MAYTKTSAHLQDLQNADQLTTNKQFIDAIAKATTIQHYEKKGSRQLTAAEGGTSRPDQQRLLSSGSDVRHF